MMRETIPEVSESSKRARARRRKLFSLAGVVLALVAIGLQWFSAAPGRVEAVGSFTNPHTGGSIPTDSCAACHRTHEGEAPGLLKLDQPQSTLCLTCHDGTGANSNVQGELTASTVVSKHPVLDASALRHTSGQDDEFGGKLNRHSECTDCHNPHTLSANLAVSSPAGTPWLLSGAETGVTGVSGSSPQTFLKPATYEYQLCLKCHSAYTQLLTSAKDKAAEFLPSNASYHPVEAAGKNNTAAMQASLDGDGGTLWKLKVGDTIRCTNCHADSRLLAGNPAPGARLAPHASAQPTLLLAPYKTTGTTSSVTLASDFALCFLCHSKAPFTSGGGTTATNFANGSESLHYLHVGEKQFVCSECHANSHGNATTPHLVKFASDVQGYPIQTPPLPPLAPVFLPGTNGGGSCTLTCHGEDHNGTGEFSYLPSARTGSATTAMGSTSAPATSGGTTLLPKLVAPTPTATPTNTPTPTPTPMPKPQATPTPSLPVLLPITR